MKNRNLLLAFFLLIFTGVQAQDHSSSSCCVMVSEKGTSKNKTTLISNEKMQAILDEEVLRFTKFMNTETEYPDLAKDHCLEGKVIVRVVYNQGFESAKIIQSADPLLDKIVMDKIDAYIENFDRTYENAPRLVFNFPINFRLKG